MKVGFIGLGLMGSLMSANVAKAGHALRSFDLNGKGNCASAEEAARGADVLITMVPDGKAVRKAVLAALPGLAAGAIVIDMSSSDPGTTKELGAALKKKGVRMLDAPVSGAIGKARDGTLALMVGGDAARLEEVRGRYAELGRAFQRFQDANRTWETSPAPNIRFQGAQLREDLELWKQVVTNLTLNHEQALLEAQNDTQTLLLLDPGNLPVEKSKPARSLIVFAALCAAGAGSWLTFNRAMVYDQFIAKETKV